MTRASRMPAAAVNDLNIVLDHAARGIPIVPIHGVLRGRCDCGDPGCGSPGKHPLTRHGLSDASVDPAVIRAWWGRWPGCNWAGRTGVRFDVLDVDPGGLPALATLADDVRLPRIYRVATTGRGLHLYMPVTGAPNATGGKRGWPEHLDYRGRGGYVLMEPSRHVSGRWYRPRECVDLAGDLAMVADRVPVSIPMPWEVPAAPTLAGAAPNPRRLQGTGTTSAYGRRVLDRVCAELRAAPEGSREVTMSQVAVMTAARTIEGGHLDPATAIAEIENAARACGLSVSEVNKVGRVLSRIGDITHPISPAAKSDVERLADWIVRQPLVRAHRGLLKALSELGGTDREANAAILADGGRRAGIPDHLVRAAVGRALKAPAGAAR